MTVLVTGAAGHVGANLVRMLLARGEPVRALVHRDRRGVEGLDVETVHGDICAPDDLTAAFKGARVVYHAAGHISLLQNEGSLLERVNVRGTRNVVAACLAAGVQRLVHFGSIHALELPSAGGLVDEESPLVGEHQRAPYDRSKAAAEREVLRGIEQGLDAIILNPTAIVGPYDYRPSHFGQVLLALARGRMPALVEGGFDWVDARDVVEGAWRAQQAAPSGSRYMLGGHWVSVRDIATLVAQVTGRRAPRLVCPMGLARLVAPWATAASQLIGKRPLFTSFSLEVLCGEARVSHERARRDLGYQPRPFEETVADTLAWFAAHGALDLPEPEDAVAWSESREGGTR